MKTGFTIKSITNSLDGQTAEVVLSGTPNGAVTFQISRTPDMALPGAASATYSDGVYTVAFPAPVLWWITATDSDGATTPNPVWINLADDADLNLAGRKIESVLQANRAALDLALSMSFPGLKWKQIGYGCGTIIREFPSILITKPTISAAPVAFPYTWDETYSFQIFAMIFHQDRTSYESVAAAIANRILRILNQPAYFGLVLPNGTMLANCGCRQGDSSDVELDEKTFGAIGSLVWRGDALVQDSMSQAL